MSLVTMNNIERAVRSPNVNYETVGYINTSNLRMYQTGVSQRDPKNGRKYVEFPQQQRIRWHTHPHTDGFWPSFEDLNHGYNDQGVLNVLFTRFGTWLFRGFGKVPDRFHHDLLYQNWYWLHLVLQTRTSTPGWTEVEMMKYVDYFVNIVNRIGYHIEFVPNFKSMDMDKYTQLVQDWISHLSR